MDQASPSGDELLRVLTAMASPHRLRIIAALAEGRTYVSQLARQLQMNRPLLYMHLQRLEAAGLVTGVLETARDGSSVKYFELVPFALELTPEAVIAAVRSLGAEQAETDGPAPGAPETGGSRRDTSK
ncbi:winged helix-turn-helix transcriptional regulator [Plantactinospora sp. S1510]|uniref:Winged helix-turn-helix transcriptional regulator n=1 Tax=Plantactinospora alkalitolerans TaxID=2789879 RepID=A0ABS0GYM9_9ACTN|nr:winged helix-turn-helix domain-containing protein [Plantactinospora alkalitolerans]MBF9131331.1 winged helix-turn-helix transcriptional regulator [Plantactinospora alkalitolerans]